MELKEVDGQICIVVHLVMDDRNLKFCTGREYEHPSENDKRPRTFCENCRLKALETLSKGE